MDHLQGKVAIVTGAGRGIGRAVARKLAQAGAAVVLAGRTPEALEATAGQIRADGGEALALPADVTREESVKALVAGAVKAYGRLDCAFNNAGTFGKFGLLEKDTLENFDAVVSTNLKGVWLCMREEIPAMLAHGGGAIVNCSSVSGLMGHLQSCVYSASKHGVAGLTKSAALQYARRGIRVNAVCPGSTDTEMLREVYFTEELLKDRADLLPIGRFAAPEEIAELAVWLCSDRSSFVTGQIIAADGGVTAGRGERARK